MQNQKQIVIRNAVKGDFESIIEINEVEAIKTSPMDIQKLCYLDKVATYHKVAVIDNYIVAFLLAFRHNATYANDNYEWFASRFDKFVYIDRIVVRAESKGLKIGSLLYKDLFIWAQKQNINVITCEYNIQPSNIPSKKFHDKFGFIEVGKQWVAKGTKLVSLQMVKI